MLILESVKDNAITLFEDTRNLRFTLECKPVSDEVVELTGFKVNVLLEPENKQNNDVYTFDYKLGMFVVSTEPLVVGYGGFVSYLHDKEGMLNIEALRLKTMEPIDATITELKGAVAIRATAPMDVNPFHMLSRFNPRVGLARAGYDVGNWTPYYKSGVVDRGATYYFKYDKPLSSPVMPEAITSAIQAGQLCFSMTDTQERGYYLFELPTKDWTVINHLNELMPMGDLKDEIDARVVEFLATRNISVTPSEHAGMYNTVITLVSE